MLIVTTAIFSFIALTLPYLRDRFFLDSFQILLILGLGSLKRFVIGNPMVGTFTEIPRWFSHKAVVEACTEKKIGVVPNLKWFLPWAHGKNLFWFRGNCGVLQNHYYLHRIKVP